LCVIREKLDLNMFSIVYLF